MNARLNAAQALSGDIGAGSVVVNDYRITTEPIDGGHRIAVTRGSEVQTMDIMDGPQGQKGDKGDTGAQGEPGKDAPQDVVRYAAQSLVAEQQAQARENIGAADAATVNELKDDLVYLTSDSKLGLLNCRYTKNNSILQKGRVTVNGEIEHADGFSYIKIPIVTNDIITFFPSATGMTNPYGYCLTGENDELIVSKSGNTNTKITVEVPENAVYFLYSLHDSDWDNPTYNTFNVCRKGTFKQTLDIDYEMFNGLFPFYNYTKENNVTRFGRIKWDTGEPVQDSSFRHIEIPVEPGDYIKFHTSRTGSGSNYGYAFLDSDYNYVSGSNTYYDDETIAVAPNNASYFRYGFYVDDWNNPLYNSFKVYRKGMLEKILGNRKNLSGYSWNAVGDSVTEMHLYMDYIKSICHIGFTNYGVGGSTIAKNDAHLTNQSIVERVCGLNGNNAITDADIWTVYGGLNDPLYNSRLGELSSFGSDFDITTVYGALQKICEYILNLKAKQNLILVTPHHTVRDSSFESREASIQMIRKAIIDVAEYYSLPVIDLWKCCGVSAYNITKDSNPTTTDGIHPTNLGAELIGNEFCKCFESIVI